MRIDNFKNALAGGVRPSLFRVQGAIGPTTLPDQVGFLVKTASLPATDIGEIPVEYRGRSIKLPGKRTYADWEITVISDGKFDLRNAFERWINALNDTVENTSTNPHDLAGNNPLFRDWAIDQLDRTGEPIKSYKFLNCWPKSISAIETTYDNEALAEFTVTLAYTYFTTSGVGTSTPVGIAGFPGE